MRDLAHLNVNPFVGACVEPPNICVVQGYCAKGSLQVFNFFSFKTTDPQVQVIYENSIKQPAVLAGHNGVQYKKYTKK